MTPRLGEVVLASQSDERLVELARAGHERAFAVIVERYRPELSALARRLSPDGKAEDIVQQAFLSAFAALRAGANVKHLRGWLYRIVRNTAARSQAPTCMPLDGATATDESVEDVVQQRDLAMNALAELARLPMRQRQAMVGTALDGRGRAEVATSMGVTEGAVRQLVHRARARIRTAVTAVTPWPLVRWLAPARPGSGGAINAAAGVGAASSSGAALKLGIVVASGAIATGVAAVDIHGGARRSDPVRSRGVARVVHPQGARDDDQALLVAVVARVPVQTDRSHGSHTAGTAAVATPTVRVRRGGDGAVVLPERQQSGGGGSSRSSDRVNGGSRLGGGGGSGLRRGAGSASAGGSASGLGGGSASGPGGGGLQDGSGPRQGGSGGQGRDGGSFLTPQAVMAGDGGSTRSGDGGGQNGSAGSGPGSGSGSGPTSGPGSGAGSGSGSAGVGSGPTNSGSSSAAGGSAR